MDYACALSQHPVTSQALGEVVGSVLEQIGDRPDLVLVTVTRPHAGALEDVVSTIDAVLHPLALIGCAAEGVVGPGAEVEELPAISLWAGRVGPLLSLELSAVQLADDSWHFDGLPERLGFTPTALLVLADPFTFPAPEFCAHLEEIRPGLPVIGGYASGASGPGGTRLVLGNRIMPTGAAAIVIGPAVEVIPVVSQGCRPFGRLLTVTRSEGNLIQEIAGQPAMECMINEISQHLDRSDISAIDGDGLLIGRCIDTRILDPGPGDLVFRALLGTNRAIGALAVDGPVPLGSTIRFAVRDARTAGADLTAALSTEQADAALLFTCSGRGTRMFDVPHHDAISIRRSLGSVPLAGMFAAGEFGPVGGSNFVHSFAASLALFRSR